MKLFQLAAALLCLLVSGLPASAHELRSGYLQLVEADEAVYDVVWKRPVLGGIVLDVQPVFPSDCTVSKVAAQTNASGDILEIQRASCDETLIGRTVTFEGLAPTDGDVLVRFEDREGAVRTHRVTSSDPSVAFESEITTSIFSTYFVLGVEHILIGIDHLLFLACLVLLIRQLPKLVAAITFFTIAHSVTLAATTFGWIGLSIAPVEATIALSIVFLASEILHARAGKVTMTQKYPWLVTFTFGLLHGLGFASVLSEIGLPADAIPLALLAFNLGVEAGQLFFVVLTALVVAAMRRANVFEPVRIAATYCIGSVAMVWVIERML